jgi:D-3-phosphoglycerate dehydrogenase
MAPQSHWRLVSHRGHDGDVGRILVTEKIAETGLDRLREAGHDVDLQLAPDASDLPGLIKGANALIIRSATTVTAEVLEAADELVVVGRAGIGLDNVDVEAATGAGVMVVNAPQSNTLSAAEHTMAMLLGQARNIPQAHSALKQGRWERSQWEGVELSDRTLGIIGLGRIGRLVAQRALAFGMRLIGYDPFVSADRARQLSVEMMDLDELIATSDFVTLHLAKTPETMGLINAELLAKAKPNLRIVNVARGGIIDEADLADAVRSGQIAGAAIDVFAAEPTTESPLFDLDSVVVTPHLGASTREAQDKAGETIAEQVGLALAGEFVPFAVNVSAAEASETVRPYLPLAERLGGLFAGLVDGVTPVLDIEYHGQLADYDTRILTLSVLKGMLGRTTDEPVSYVNAPTLAAEKGTEVRETTSSVTHDYVNLVTLRGAGHSISGTLTGLRSRPRIVEIDEHAVDLPPADNMLVVRNDDRPGVIGRVGTILGDAEVNINDMDVGRSAEGQGALMAIASSGPVPTPALDALRASDGITSAQVISRSD